MVEVAYLQESKYIMVLTERPTEKGGGNLRRGDL